MNFSIEMYSVSLYGELLPKGTWIGLMGELQSQRANISISDMSITALRSETVDFALGIYEQSCHLFMQTPEQSASWKTFINVFYFTFWLALTIIVLAASVIYYLTMGQRPLKAFSTVLLSLGMLSVGKNRLKLSSKLLLFTMCIFGAVVYWSYNAFLVSILAVESYALPIQSLEDLLIKRDYQLMTNIPTALGHYFSQASQKGNPTAYKIYTETMKDNRSKLLCYQLI